jgi:Ammonium Transporter Family
VSSNTHVANVKPNTTNSLINSVKPLNHSLCGLVAITSGCAVVESWAAVVIGIVAGWVYIFCNYVLIRLKLDDAVDAIQVHLGGGLWGIIATGLLACPRHMISAYGTDTFPGFFYSPTSHSLLPAHLTGIAFIVGWTFATTIPFFSMLDYFGLFRVNALEELVGLDMTYIHIEAPNDEEPEDNEELRLAAYRQRFAERKRLRELAATRRSSLSNSHHSSVHNTAASWREVPKLLESDAPKESYPIRNHRRRSDDDELSHQGSLHSA